MYAARIEQATVLAQVAHSVFARVADKLRSAYAASLPTHSGESMSMFHNVSKMNEAFGNPKGNPANIQDERDSHLRQCQNIGSEFQELMNAFGIRVDMTFISPSNYGPVDVDGVRDALCDIMVFALGAFHRMGIDAERDMDTVVSAVMTRFCKDVGDLVETQKKYRDLGVGYTMHGEFPFVYLRSASDQQMPEYPKGKFLKSVSCRQPEFYPLPVGPLVPVAEPVQAPAPPARKFFGQVKTEPSVTDQMAAERNEHRTKEELWKNFKCKALLELTKDLESVDDQSVIERLLAGELKIVTVIKLTSPNPF
jgi:Phosphoribosyl-ATP pyrophosphohydrolase